jgi:IS5 family transposase
MKQIKAHSFADLAAERRKVKSEFFDQINTLVDWRHISNIINKYYTKGSSNMGAAAYDGLLLFKMALLQTWYGLSDYEIEDRLNDSISFSKFCGLSMDKSAPDHSTLSRFRTYMTEKGVYEKLFKELNKQLIKFKIIVKTGAIVDASIVDSPLKPHGSTTYAIVEDRSEETQYKAEIEKAEAQMRIIKKEQPGVDSEARWIKKAGKLRFGYKKHFVTDNQGLVLGVHTTAANINEITNLEEVLCKADLPEGIPLKADKGYQSEKNAFLLQTKNLKNHILKKAKRNKPLTHWEKLFNKIISKTRFKVERTFGSCKRWFNSTCARYRGLAKMHTQNLMEAMAYNLYRSPRLALSIQQSYLLVG